MMDLAKKNLETRNSIILDGTFGKKEQRKLVYNIARRISAQIVLLNSFCNDKKEKVRRIKSEGKDVDSLCIKEWLQKSYDELDKSEINKNKLIVIDIDTDCFSIKTSNRLNKFEIMIFNTLNEIVTYLGSRANSN